jgi:hypothetical protein
VGDANLLDGDASGQQAATVVGSVPLAAATTGAVQVLVRPEALAISPGEPGVAGGSAMATVELTEYYGHDSLFVVRTDAGDVVRVRSGAATAVQRGDRVSVRYAGPPTVAFAPEP